MYWKQVTLGGGFVIYCCQHLIVTTYFPKFTKKTLKK